VSEPPKPGRGPQHDRGAIDLVEAVIDDTRALIAAHVEALREDMTARLTSLGEALSSTLLAFSIMIVTALLLGIALAQTIAALGVPTWAAYWIVTVAGAGLGFGMVLRAQAKARGTGAVAGDAAERIKDDVAWIAGNTDSATQAPAQPQLPPARTVP
jgi:hypothetical protein